MCIRDSPITIPRKGGITALQDEVNTKVVAIMIKGGKISEMCIRDRYNRYNYLDLV